jgi:hypothetical protein
VSYVLNSHTTAGSNSSSSERHTLAIYRCWAKPNNSTGIMVGSTRQPSPRVWELRVYIGRDSGARVRHKYATFEGT